MIQPHTDLLGVPVLEIKLHRRLIDTHQVAPWVQYIILFDGTCYRSAGELIYISC
jgi:hypothetical protein